MFKRSAATLLTGVLAAVPFAGSAKADDATFRSIQYHANSQPVIYCPLIVSRDKSAQAFLCEVSLDRGERIKDGLNAQAQLWDPHVVYEGDDLPTPHLVLKPDAVGDVANVIITTDRRTYRILFKSVPGTSPMYVAFRYDDESRLAARNRAQYLASHPTPKPSPSSTPLSALAQMDAACGSMPATERYGTSVKPTDIRPTRTCHDAIHTYIQLPQKDTAPSDTPVVVEVTAEGDRSVNYTFDADSRSYRIDGVADEYALLAGRDRMRVQRQTSKVATK